MDQSFVSRYTHVFGGEILYVPAESKSLDDPTKSINIFSLLNIIRCFTVFPFAPASICFSWRQRCQSCCRRRRGRGGRERRGRRRGPPGLPRRTPDERKMYSTPLVVLCVFSVLTLQVKKKIVIIQLLFIIFIISKSPCPSPDEVVSTLGAGAFGKVVECLDRDK